MIFSYILQTKINFKFQNYSFMALINFKKKWTDCGHGWGKIRKILLLLKYSSQNLKRRFVGSADTEWFTEVPRSCERRFRTAARRSTAAGSSHCESARRACRQGQKRSQIKAREHHSCIQRTCPGPVSAVPTPPMAKVRSWQIKLMFPHLPRSKWFAHFLRLNLQRSKLKKLSPFASIELCRSLP